MLSRLRRLLMAGLLLFPALAMAGTEVVEVYHLPLSEAASAVQSQLSSHGQVRSMASRRMLIITDDAAHIAAAKALLKRLDTVPAQYRVQVEIVEVRDTQQQAAAVQSARLPGGWIELRLDRSLMQLSQRRRMQLRVTASQPGHIEAGELRPYRQRIWQWLAGYGVVPVDQVELVPVTSGFDIEVSKAGGDAVRVHLKPWMRRMAQTAPGENRTRIDLGQGRVTTTSRQQPNTRNAPIAIRGAETELTLSLGESVTIAANQGESKLFSQALLGISSGGQATRLAIRLRVVSAAR
jgi:hypothetical protein